MSFLFPSLVRLSRPQGNTGAGAQPYSGLSQQKETVIVTAARAHIQPERQGQAPLAGLPADAAGQPTWKVILKLPKGTIQKRDVLTDELGNRYQAIYSAWTPLGTTVLAVGLNGLGTPPVRPRIWGATGLKWGASGKAWGGNKRSWGGADAAWGSSGRRWG